MYKMRQAEFNALERNKSGYLVIPECTDCTGINFGAADKVIFGDGCKLGDWCALGSDCELGNYCTLGDRCNLGNCCILGWECKLGNKCILGNYCELGNDCELGYRCKLGNYCVLGYQCKLGDNCVLGDDCHLASGCKLGNCCVLGNDCILDNSCVLGDDCELGFWCRLGDQCVLGNRCELGEYCKLGEYIDVRATFENGRVQDGLYVQNGNIGSDHRTAYFYIDKDGAIFVRAGCWFSGMEDFKVRVKSVHGGTIYEAQYMAACAYAETVLPQMLKESDAERKEQQHEN